MAFDKNKLPCGKTAGYSLREKFVPPSLHPCGKTTGYSRSPNKKLIYEKLTYEIIGCLYEVDNALGGGLKEKSYQQALAVSFKNKGLEFREQVYFPVKFQESKVGSHFFDFLVDGKVVVELKTKKIYNKKDIDQLFGYLKLSKLKLGLLVNFTDSGVRFKRVANIL